LDIKNAVVAAIPAAGIDFEVNPTLEKIVKSFGVLDDTAAQVDWGWAKSKPRLDLATAVGQFIAEVQTYPKRIKSPELFGA
jgi:hypothetical protein